ncbi:Putative PIN domain nucleic acid-binding protein [Planktothrix agardhii]|jgi:predicted nucleic-acid-binding protein|uniref:Putative PIN domain nucleic acid-binding protein n=1 Tax=Planktothrix agardhii TaxID=1160 RepID=A0A1J1JAK2_PLAAG|nr:type II toxin-antitoxin system VapC family toxin [Planktothrix agardhii]MCF3575632.1 type II toxin-antitoxin system VapC family toxin [Planktothrix agardhii 1812]MCF3580545.1 type II toxin-antitoxin system VapC family toxin [Planktothrix agardhii 1811]MCF3625134.1 type II toxin-antitoxin system VapC family toxin [Planktothrix agardhii 1801]CAD5957917.1 Putative PIN domain nucleic acid-binding protein [Planktothrix agardhii]CAD5971430.1 Putative PIN domain nucleic acid-binding protein [Plank
MESMIAIDTNIIVRFITRDDELQYQQSLELFKNKNIFIPDTVILETEWVLRFAYKFKPLEICQSFRKVLGLPNIYLTNEKLILQIIKWHENGIDFADAFHLASSNHCLEFYTFDEKFIKKSQSLSISTVKHPDL